MSSDDKEISAEAEEDDTAKGSENDLSDRLISIRKEVMLAIRRIKMVRQQVPMVLLVKY